MSFLKRRRFKFGVDLQVVQLTDVPLVNAVLFAKVRLLQGGTFESTTERVEVQKHSVDWHTRFQFSCRIASDATTGVLDKCLCRVSVRKVSESTTRCDSCRNARAGRATRNWALSM